MDSEAILLELKALREEVAALRRQIVEDKMAQPVREMEQVRRMGGLWTQRLDLF